VDKISLEKMADMIKEYWTPLDIFRVNDSLIRMVKIKGKYHWHKHTDQDELFIVLKGRLKLNFKNQQLVLDEGEGFVVKNGTIHQSEADEETVVLLVEPINIVTKGD
jgi:mannose-6-phosphate isomerase-like protein (cupin superfamily)